jgi:CheY-like chemotaxis protein
MTFPLNELTILLVGNNQHMLRLLQTILHSNGVKSIHMARDGRIALEMIRINALDLMIAEGLMTPMDGMELTRYIRHSEKSPNPNLPIVLITGSTDGTRSMAIEAGASEIVKKPLYAKTLIDSIRNIMTHHRSPGRE